MRLVVPSAVLVLATAACGGRAPMVMTGVADDAPVEESAASLPTLPPAVGPEVTITDGGVIYQQINESDCLTWPSPEAKARGGMNGWEMNLVPKQGDSGTVIGESVHCDSGEKIVFVQFEQTVAAVAESGVFYPMGKPEPVPAPDLWMDPRCRALDRAVAAAPTEFASERGERYEQDLASHTSWYTSDIALSDSCAIVVDDDTGHGWHICSLAESESSAGPEKTYEDWLELVDACVNWKYVDGVDDTFEMTTWSADFEAPSSPKVSLMFTFEENKYSTRLLVEAEQPAKD